MSTGSSVCLAGSRFTEQVITDAVRPAQAGIQVREARPGMGVMPGSRVRETEREPPGGGLEDLNLGRGKGLHFQLDNRAHSARAVLAL